MRNTQMASTTEYEDERVNLSKDAPKQARPRKKILVPPKPHEKRYSSFNKPQITLDTETTGLDPDKGDRILEIGCVRLNGREISLDPDDYLQIYINPERDIPEETTAIHGITNEKVKDCPVFADIVDEFLDFVSDTELLIHNAKFDVGFINMELERLGRGRLEDYVAQITDTLEIAREMYPGRRVSLDGLCLMHKIDNSARVFHGALLDSQLLAEVYLTMTRGQGEIDLDNWGDAVEIPPEIIARLTAPYSRKNGKSPFENRREIQETNWVNVGVVRRQDRLETALTDFASLRHDVEKASVSGNKVYNMEFNTHLDTLNMLDVSVMAAVSALQREETRGAHTREDFPKQRDEYGLFNTFMWRGGDGMPVFEKKDVVFKHKSLEECQKHKK